MHTNLQQNTAAPTAATLLQTTCQISKLEKNTRVLCKTVSADGNCVVFQRSARCRAWPMARWRVRGTRPPGPAPSPATPASPWWAAAPSSAATASGARPANQCAQVSTVQYSTVQYSSVQWSSPRKPMCTGQERTTDILTLNLSIISNKFLNRKSTFLKLQIN